MLPKYILRALFKSQVGLMKVPGKDRSLVQNSFERDDNLFIDHLTL